MHLIPFNFHRFARIVFTNFGWQLCWNVRVNARYSYMLKDALSFIQPSKGASENTDRGIGGVYPYRSPAGLCQSDTHFDDQTKKSHGQRSEPSAKKVRTPENLNRVRQFCNGVPVAQNGVMQELCT